MIEHDHRLTTGAQDATHLAKRPARVRGVMEHPEGVDDIESIVGKRQSLRVPNQEVTRHSLEPEP